MASYLLGTQALIDIARNTETPVHAWAEASDLQQQDVVISSISFSQLHYEVQAIPVSDQRRAVWDKLYSAVLARFRRTRAILPVTLDIALRLAEIKPLKLQAQSPDDGKLHDLGTSSRLVLATALEENLTLVDRRQPCHDVLADHGLVLVDPYSP